LHIRLYRLCVLFFFVGIYTTIHYTLYRVIGIVSYQCECDAENTEYQNIRIYGVVWYMVWYGFGLWLGSRAARFIENTHREYQQRMKMNWIAVSAYCASASKSKWANKCVCVELYAQWWEPRVCVRRESEGEPFSAVCCRYIHMYIHVVEGKGLIKCFWLVTFVHTYVHTGMYINAVRSAWALRTYSLHGVWEKYKTVCMHMYILTYVRANGFFELHRYICT